VEIEIISEKKNPNVLGKEGDSDDLYYYFGGLKKGDQSINDKHMRRLEKSYEGSVTASREKEA